MSRDDEVVLVIEDDMDVAEMLELVLENDGLEVETARHGQEGLEWLRRGNTPRVIVLDMMMPVMDGWTFLAELRRQPAWTAIPVLVLTGGRFNDELLPNDVAGRMRKPIDRGELISTVRRYVD